MTNGDTRMATIATGKNGRVATRTTTEQTANSAGRADQSGPEWTAAARVGGHEMDRPTAAPRQLCQRWSYRWDSYRPVGEPLDVRRYGVEVLTEAVARKYIIDHHYSGSYPAARCRVGLFRCGGELVGVAVFSVPAGPKVLKRWLPHLPTSRQGVELGRFVLADDVPGNGETWFLARAFEVLKAELPEVRAVLSFADPMQRVAVDGRVVTPGHVGCIYQAHNGRHVGRTWARTMWLDRDAQVVSERALSKLRTGDRGAAYAYEVLRAAGAPTRQPLEDGRSYVRRALREGPFRRVRHPGNLAYTWPIGDRRVRRAFPNIPPARPYPKADSAIVRMAA